MNDGWRLGMNNFCFSGGCPLGREEPFDAEMALGSFASLTLLPIHPTGPKAFLAQPRLFRETGGGEGLNSSPPDTIWTRAER